jgi:hypothetical protein
MSDYIPGIFNYCDRWCERCPLTARCRQFAMEELMNRHSDIQNAEFWEEFRRLFPINPEFEEMLAEALEEVEEEEVWSSSLRDPVDEEASEDKFDRPLQTPLVQAAFKYAADVRNWLSTTGLRNHERAAGSPGNVDRDDALDIIEWYALQIGVKLARASHSLLVELDEDYDPSPLDDEPDAESSAANPFEDPVDDDEDPDALWEDDITRTLREADQHDRDGSAKVALIGIERSLGALTLLRRELPGEEAAIKPLVQHLARLRVALDREWPGARTFIRPGFDE